MKITGIIAEYNPFHNGHRYQLEFAKKYSDAVVAVMSGSFVQRGEAAILDKWTRAQMALLCGVDLVLELPACFCVNSAERFAFGAVFLLDQFGIIDTLCFGSESGDISELTRAAALLLHEPDMVSKKIQQYLAAGESHPAARQKAYAGLIPESILCQPNNILALEYLCALERLKSHIRPVTLGREAVGYHDQAPKGLFASAAAVRIRMQNGADYFAWVPTQLRPVYETAVHYDTARLDTAISCYLRTANPERLRAVSGVAEGLENRLIAAGRQYDSIEDIVQHTVTKRYTAARIRRICLSALLGLTPDLARTPPRYARVLGMNQTGKSLLAAIRKTTKLQIVTKTADYNSTDSMFAKDILATDLAALCADSPTYRQAGKDYKTTPVIL